MTVKEYATSTSRIRPIWGLQFILIMLLYHLSAYLLSIVTTYVEPKYCYMLLGTSTAFAWLTAIAIMNQRSYHPISLSKTFWVHLIGIPIYVVLGLMCYSAPGTISSFLPVKAILLLSFALAALFLFEVLMVIPISRRNNRILSGVDVPEKRKISVEEKDDFVPPEEPEKREITTSVSSLRLPPDADETTKPDHSYRKVSFARRREYVDAPTSAPSVAAVKMAEIQTEPTRVSVEGSQTCKCDLKEVLVQTVSRCEFCNQHMQAGAAVPSQQPICGTPCPTVVQLLRSGIALPYCSNCSCAASILQMDQKQQPQPLQYPKKDQSKKPQLSYPRKDSSKPQQLQYQRQEPPQSQQLQYQQPEQPPPQQQRITSKTSQQIQPEEQRMPRTVSKESDKGDGSKPLTSFTKVTVTAFCAGSNATTMEVATSSCSKENIVTLIPPQSTMEGNGRPQITTSSQQTEKIPRMMGVQCQEIELRKEETIYLSECYDIETSTAADDEEYQKPPSQPIQMATLKTDDDEPKTDVKKSDTKESRQIQTPKTSRDVTATGKSRRGRESSNLTRHVKRTKRPASQPILKEKKEDCGRTYSRFLPLEDRKPRDPRCIEQDYDLSNICVPMHAHDVVEYPSCSGNRAVFHRSNRIDPGYVPECEGYAIQTDPHFQCSVDTPAETSTTLLATTATTDTDICPACKNEQVESLQANIFQYYNVYKDKEGRVYCDTCAPPNSNKVPIITDRSEDILQECSICGNFPYIIDARSVGVVYRYEERSFYCIKCGQLQS